jgi:hypothetical protein
VALWRKMVAYIARVVRLAADSWGQQQDIGKSSKQQLEGCG